MTSNRLLPWRPLFAGLSIREESPVRPLYFLLALLVVSGVAQADAIFLCKAASSEARLWSRATCITHKAVTLEYYTVPDHLSFDDQVRIAEQMREAKRQDEVRRTEQSDAEVARMGRSTTRYGPQDAEDERNARLLRKVKGQLLNSASVQFADVILRTDTQWVCGRVRTKDGAGRLLGYAGFMVTDDRVLISSGRGAEEDAQFRRALQDNASGCRDHLAKLSYL